MKGRTRHSLAGLGLLALGILALAVGCAPTAPVEARRTCAQCHPDKVAAFQTGIVHQPVKEKNCETCHLPHGLVGTVLIARGRAGTALGATILAAYGVWLVVAAGA